MQQEEMRYGPMIEQVLDEEASLEDEQNERMYDAIMDVLMQRAMADDAAKRKKIINIGLVNFFLNFWLSILNFKKK